MYKYHVVNAFHSKYGTRLKKCHKNSIETHNFLTTLNDTDVFYL